METIRKSKGRQRLKLKFIEDKKNRDVTFTKRRNGIYKKASEMCILTGVEIAILITTLSGKTFSFAHPNIESVESRCLRETILPQGILEPYREVHIKDLINQLDDACKNLKVEEERAKILKEMRDERVKKIWEQPIEELTPDDAQKAKKQLRELQAKIFSIQNEQFRRHLATDANETAATICTM